MTLPSLQKPAIAALFLLAGYTAGYALSRQQQGAPPATATTAPPALQSLPIEQAMAEDDPQRQLQWLALHAEEEIPFASTLDNLTQRRTGKNSKAFQELLTLWASRDPDAARAYVMNLKGWHLRNALASLAEGWAQKDVASLAEWLKSDEGRKFHSSPYHALTSIARHDPHLAFSMIDENDPENSIAYHYLFNTLAKTDLRAALHLLEQTRPDDRQSALGGMMYEWANREPDAALSWVQGITDDKLRQTAIQSLSSALSMTFPEKAGDLIASELGKKKGVEEVQTLLHSFLYSWNVKDPAAAGKWVATLPRDYRETAMATNRSVLAQANPTAYLQALEETKTIAPNEVYTFSSSLAALARSDPSKIAEWIGQNQEWLPKQTLATAISDVTLNHPALAPQLLPMLTKGTATNRAYTKAGEHWADKDVAAAAQFLAALPPGEERDAFQQGIFQQTLSVNPQEAYQMVEATPEGALRTDLLNALASKSQEYQTTADWISARFSDSKDGATALSKLMIQWGKAAPAEAATWLKNTPEGATKDQLVSSYSTSIVRHDPDMAIQWATSINDEKARSRAMEQIARSWLHIDRSAAREWINSAPFSNQTKERLLKYP